MKYPNLYIMERMQSLERELKNKEFSPKQLFRICNKLDNILEYVREEV